jgi:hypothetical protein
MSQHKLSLKLVTAIWLTLASSYALATSTGISSNDGYSDPSDPENTCAASGCHSGGSFSGSAAWTGSQSLAPGGFDDYTYRVSGSNASRNGVSLSTRSAGGVRSGTFSNVSTEMQITTSNTHITHTTPAAAGKTWGFRWTAPATVGVYTMYGCINQVDFAANGAAGDGPPVCDTNPITVNTSPNADNETIGVNEDSGGNTFLASTLLTGDTSGTSGNETGDTVSIDTTYALVTTGSGSAVYSGSNIVYTPASNDDTDDSLTYRVVDSLGATDIATINIPITPQNDAPSIAVDNSSAPAYEEGNPPVVLDSSIGITDIDDTNLTSAEVDMDTNYANGQDVLACGSATTGITSCTFNTTNGTLTLSGNTTKANYVTALQKVTYANSSLDPSTLPRSVRFRVNDGSVFSAYDTISVAVSSVSTPPSSTGFSGTVPFTEGNTATPDATSAVLIGGSVIITDPDTGLQEAILEITPATLQSPEDQLLCPDTLPLNGLSCVQGTGMVTLSSAGSNTLVEYQNAIAGVQYNNVSNDPATTPDRIVELTITDSSGTPALSTPSKTITVAATNDSPTSISEPIVRTATEETEYSFTFEAVDPDDANDGTELTYSIFSGAQSGMVINNGLPDYGLFTWTPPRTGLFSDTYDIVIQATDGDIGSTPVNTSTITLTVSPPDSDVGGGDGYADYDDNCPTVRNGVTEDNQADFDLDTVRTLPQMDISGIPALGDIDPSDPATGGDACDTDDDNDGIPDVIEEDTVNFPFLNSKDPTDAGLDFDGDGLTNLQEYNNDNSGATMIVDSVGPAITVPADINVDSTGFLTAVDIGTATAADVNFGVSTAVIPVVPVVNTTISTCAELGDYPAVPEPFRPGAHVVTWTTCDGAGNLVTAVQNVLVNPLLSTGSYQVTGEGRRVRFEVMLNGPIDDDVNVDYTITGTVTAGVDYAVVGNPTATSGTITILGANSTGTVGDRVGFIEIDIPVTGVPQFRKTISLALSNPVNAALGTAINQDIVVIGFNAPPVVEDITVDQNGVMVGSTVTVNEVTLPTASIQAVATDPNNIILFYDWSATDNALNPPMISTDTFVIDTASLAPGLYPIEVSVTDGALTTTRNMLLVAQGAIATVLPAVDSDGDGALDSNAAEGFGDEDGDGIPNYLDNLFLTPDMINNQTGNLAGSYIIQTDPGLNIRKGSTATAAGAAGVLISQAQLEANGGSAGGPVVNAVDGIANTSGLYDFEITGLNLLVESANVVIPLPSALQLNSVYRKYSETNGWFSFVQDSKNRVSSAAGEPGACPPPGSPLYAPGLTAFHYCVQLTIEDGGPNDADGARNFVIKDPGGVAVQPSSSSSKSSDSDGRIGVIDPLLFLVMLLPFAYVYRKQIRREMVRIVNRQKRR